MKLTTEQKIPGKVMESVVRIDAKLNEKQGYKANDLKRYIETLFQYGSVDVGWRESCGRKDHTQTVHGEWVKIVKQLEKNGIQIAQERVKYKNSYATLSNGFWQSIIYSLTPTT